MATRGAKGFVVKFASYIKTTENDSHECTLCGNRKFFELDMEDVAHCMECHGTGRVIEDIWGGEK